MDLVLDADRLDDARQKRTYRAELSTLQGHEAPVGKLQFSADGSKLASSGIIRGTLIWDLEKRRVVRRLKENDVFFTPDLARGVFTYPTGEFGIFDVETLVGDKSNLGINGIHAIAADGDARIVAVPAADDAIHVIDRRTSSVLVTHRGHTEAALRRAQEFGVESVSDRYMSLFRELATP